MNRILIVEDDRDIAGNLLLLLKKEGFTFTLAAARRRPFRQKISMPSYASWKTCLTQRTPWSLPWKPGGRTA